MDLQLSGKVAVVTGASRGIGLATARALVGEGATVVAAARTVTAEMKDSGALALPIDLTEPGAATTLVDHALTEAGGIDILVNNVGGGDVAARGVGGFRTVDDAVWAGTLDLNLLVPVRVIRAALPSLLERRGAIVSVSSTAARQPDGPVDYAAAKAALTTLGRSLAVEFAAQGLRVTTVSPGPVRTAMWEAEDGYGAHLAAAMGVDHDAFVAGLPQAMGLLTGRLVEPDEVAAFIAYLASPLAASMTGTDYLIDGGLVRAA